MKRILCPTDFSETASNAITYAAKLANKLNARLDLYNIQSLGDRTPEEAIQGKSLNLATANAQLEELCVEVSKVFKISCYSEVESSVTSVNKLIAAKAAGYDLMVMGTNGPDDLFQFFLGSNTFQVARQSTVPLLLLPQGCGYSEITQIVYAFDYWRKDRLPMGQLLEFVKALSCDLLVLEVMEASISAKAEWEIQETQKILLDQYAGDISMTFDTLHTSNLVDSVNDYVIRRDADVLALCSEHHNLVQSVFHKSVVKALSAKASYPVFVFHG